MGSGSWGLINREGFINTNLTLMFKLTGTIRASYLQPSAFRRPSSLLPVCRLQKAFVSKMSLCKSRACIKAMLV